MEKRLNQALDAMKDMVELAYMTSTEEAKNNILEELRQSANIFVSMVEDAMK